MNYEGTIRQVIRQLRAKHDEVSALLSLRKMMQTVYNSCSILPIGDDSELHLNSTTNGVVTVTSPIDDC